MVEPSKEHTKNNCGFSVVHYGIFKYLIEKGIMQKEKAGGRSTNL